MNNAKIESKMSEQEMYSSLQNIWENLSYDGNREIYSQMLVLLDNIRYLLCNDLQIGYPEEYYDSLNNYITQEGNFTF